MNNRILILVFFSSFLFRTGSSQIFTDSNLPVIIIDTDGGEEIPDDPRILATMKIIYRGEGLRNYLSDADIPEYLNYDGRISIELRGSSSQDMEKKSYGLSTKKDDGFLNNNVSILGLPADNDWILVSNVFDPSMMRNYLSFNLSRMIGEYASRTVFCELIVNGDYKGLYLLLEKIKPGKQRVDILEIGSSDNTYPEITGGYITKSDKTTGGDPVAWFMSSYNWTNDIVFIHHSPSPEDITSQQNNYIRSEFLKLSSTASAGNQSPVTGYPSVIDIPSFIDFIILNELASNADAYSLSTFYHKDRNGKIRAGPLWDMDLTFGNDLFIYGYDRSKTNFWQFSNGENDGPRYWRDLFNNMKFRCYLSARWHELTAAGKPLSRGSIEALIEATATMISEAAERENDRWATIGDFSSQIADLKTFVQQRIEWITLNIGSYTGCADQHLPSLVITRIMYAPDTSAEFPESRDMEFLEIMNTGNETEDLTGVYFSGTGFIFNFLPGTTLTPGESVILAGNAAAFRSRYGFLPFGEFTRNLSDTGEKLVLADAFGNIIDYVEYSDQPPWPDARFNGYYLSLNDPFSDNSLASSWTLSKSTIVSVSDSENEDKIRVYPLPSDGYLTIESEGTISSIELFDITGYKLESFHHHDPVCKLDMTHYSPGIYLIRILTSGGNSVRKVIRK